jgi:hypothetical protein
MDAIAFLLAHAGIAGAGQPVFMGWYHLSPLFDISILI